MSIIASDYECTECGEVMKSFNEFEEFQHENCGGLVRPRGLETTAIESPRAFAAWYEREPPTKPIPRETMQEVVDRRLR